MPRSPVSENHEATPPFWSSHREATLNWLAFGLLLAAWNAADNDAATPVRRPDSLRRYALVSVRAATLHSAEPRAGVTH